MKKKSRLLVAALAVLVVGLFVVWGYPRLPTAPEHLAPIKINETTYCFQDGLIKSRIYLLLGKEKALLIDTGYGMGRLDEAVRAVSKLPLVVVNTHGHFDHVGNNALFDTVHMSEKDREVYRVFRQAEVLDMLYSRYPWQKRRLAHQEIKTVKSKRVTPVLPLPEEGHFDLGGRIVRFFETPGHSPGSICLYDENNRFLFDGDSAGVLLNLPLSDSVETYLESVKRINAFIASHPVDLIHSGHAPNGRDPKVYKALEKAASDIVNGKISATALEAGQYTVDGATIKFYKNKIRKADEK